MCAGAFHRKVMYIPTDNHLYMLYMYSMSLIYIHYYDSRSDPPDTCPTQPIQAQNLAQVPVGGFSS